ncbi:MAG: TIGR04211 family SH3 domain-containing protein [Myxococcota bacterium]
MQVGVTALLCLLGLGMLGAAPVAQGAVIYIRDEVRVNMRSGPGQEYRILRVVRSGDQLRSLEARDDWILVRTPEGEEGWVPARYATEAPPPSVALPTVRAKLDNAQAELEELRARLATQTEALEELGTLKQRNALLEKENRSLVWADTWRKWLTGAGIAAFFLLVGGLWPSGSGSRSRKIKL